MPDINNDIVARLTRWYDRVPSDSALFGCSSKLLDDASAEIARLRAELAAAIKQRDEARRDACYSMSVHALSALGVDYTAESFARERGWDCYAQKEGGGA